jgi:cyclic-di-AMP phosphodiesterase PgpH
MPSDNGGSSRDALRVLNRRPERFWPDGALHHGIRLALLLALAVLIHVLFPVSSLPDFPMYEIGDVPQQDIIATSTFDLPKNDEQLARERDEAAAAVAPVFRYDDSATDTVITRVRRFVAHLDSAAASAAADAERRERVRNLLNAYGFPISDETLDLLVVPAQRAALAASLERTITEELPSGIVSSSDFEDTPAPQWRITRAGTEQLIDRDSVRTQAQLYARAGNYLPADAPAGLADFQRLALILFFEGSIRPDTKATMLAREQARAAVPAARGEVLRGETIVSAYEPVREREIERLDAWRKHLEHAGDVDTAAPRTAQQLGTLLLNLLVLSILGVLLLLYRPKLYANLRHLTLLAALIAVVTGAAAIIASTGAPVELIPIAFPALVVAALWDGRLALHLVLVVAALLSIQAPFPGVSVRVLMLLGGSAAALSARLVHRRAQGLMLGAGIAFVYIVTCTSIGLVRGIDTSAILDCLLWGSINGMASSLVAMGFLPLFESFTRITTNQTLLELADLNRPLLKRLSLEASGTYAHSINVANLAESAARAVGGNPLLARVGSYYHDIGKVVMPQYFIENQARARNPHEQIDPRKSAAIVRSHVAEGLKLAEQARLPAPVLAFIPEHHGTQPIGFFYEQARKENPDADLDPGDFAYQGPKPQSKETAILMLADSVESAAKALQDPTVERIRALVDRIVDNKIAQGQLSESPLTLRDLESIRQQFTSVLSGMYHHRIDYPHLREPDAEPAVTERLP